MENKDKENDKMSEEVITDDATKDGANAAANKGKVAVSYTHLTLPTIA